MALNSYQHRYHTTNSRNEICQATHLEVPRQVCSHILHLLLRRYESLKLFSMQLDASEQQSVKKSKTTLAISGQHDNPQNPIYWTEYRKWIVNLVACYVTFIVGLNATALTAVAGQTNDAFNISDQVFPNSVWPVTAWNMGAALAPMIVLPVMENHGMRPGYLTTYSIFLLFVIPQAVAQNFPTFIICRFFAGCCGGVLQDAMDGIIADLWDKPPQRSVPVSTYVFALLGGVSMGPVIGGLIAQRLHWRW